MSRIITKICISLVLLLILYLAAFYSNRHYRDDDDILWISKNQWNAIFVMWTPFLIAIIIRY